MTKVSIVGVEGSGKTVLMAVLGDKYKLPDASGLSLKPNNFETYSYVENQMAELQGSSWPQATTPDVMQTLGWTLQHTDAKGNVTSLGEVPFLDFAGEVYRYAFGPHTDDEIKTTPKGDLTKPVRHLREHVKSSQCLVVLVNLTHVINGSRADRRTQETVWLTQRIVEFAQKAGIPRIALALTQCDRYRDEIERCGGVAGTLRQCLPHVATSFRNLNVFEVAAIGSVKPSANGSPVPCVGASPVGLENLMSFMIGSASPHRSGCLGKAVWFGLAAAMVGVAVWGHSAFQVWQRQEYERQAVIARRLAEAEKQAADATACAKAAERERRTAEAARQNAEQKVAAAEQKAVTAERERRTAETARQNAEQKVAAAERKAVTAERERRTAEMARQNAEQKVAAAEHKAVTIPRDPRLPRVAQKRRVWVEGRYVDESRENGTVIHQWQPGHYEVQEVPKQKDAAIPQKPRQPSVAQKRTVWVEGRYVDEPRENGTVIRLWQPGHYEVQEISE